MRGWKQHLRFASVVLLTVALGCSHLAQVPLDEEIGGRGDSEQPWIRIQGFTDREGTRVDVSGFATVKGDSFLIYSAEPQSRRNAEPRLLAALSRNQVRSVQVREPDPGKIYLFAAGLVLLAAGIFAVVVTALSGGTGSKPLE